MSTRLGPPARGGAGPLPPLGAAALGAGGPRARGGGGLFPPRAAGGGGLLAPLGAADLDGGGALGLAAYGAATGLTVPELVGTIGLVLSLPLTLTD
jgi:hypothetical protein